MKLVIAEKPSVAQSLATVIGATARKDGYLEGNGWRGPSGQACRCRQL
jgi:DNA topoisomerase-3